MVIPSLHSIRAKSAACACAQLGVVRFAGFPVKNKEADLTVSFFVFGGDKYGKVE